MGWGRPAASGVQSRCAALTYAMNTRVLAARITICSAALDTMRAFAAAVYRSDQICNTQLMSYSGAVVDETFSRIQLAALLAVV